MQWAVDDMKTSDYEPYRILGMMYVLFVNNSLITCSGKRSRFGWTGTGTIILNEVLSDERTFAYVTSIDDINRWWSDCKDCNWYKSRETILSEAR